ncbi:MAG: 30S ribosomal protein S13 [Proteobacteria bacterium]|nr:30S ribosomal protein S13 [Pseudomonadota bacterium]
MPRIAGVDVPNNKRIEVGLTYIYGIGRTLSKQILTEAGIDLDKRGQELTDNDIATIRKVIEEKTKVEGDLRKEVTMNIKRLMDLGCYRGQRHKKGLPVRGQNTRSNARTRKGPKKTVAVKKSIKAMK